MEPEEIARFSLPFTCNGDPFADIVDAIPAKSLLEIIDAHGILHDPPPPPPATTKCTPRHRLVRVFVIDCSGGETYPEIVGMRCPVGDLELPVQALNTLLAAHVPCTDEETFVWGYAEYDVSRFDVRQILRNDEIVTFLNIGGHDARLVAWKVPKAPDYVLIHIRRDGYGRYTRVPSVLIPKSRMQGPGSGGDRLSHAAHMYVRKALRPYCTNDPDDDDVLRDHLMLRGSTVPLDQHLVFLDDDVTGFAEYESLRVHPSASIHKLIDEWTPLCMDLAHAQETSRRSIESFRHFCYRAAHTVLCTARVSETDAVEIRVFGVPARPGLYHSHPLDDMHNSMRYRLAIFMSSRIFPRRHGYADESALVLDALTRRDDASGCGGSGEDPTALLDWLHPHQRDSVHRMLHMEDRPYGFLGTVCTPIASGALLYDVKGCTLYPAYLYPDTQATGGFLSDEPGMGKTRCLLAACLLRPSMDPEKRATLICVPSSVLGHWTDEIQRVSPHSKVCVYYGTKTKRLMNQQPQRMVSEFDIVVTTYSTYIASREVLGGVEWHRVVFDESHTLSERFSDYPPRARYRWCISATPMTNIHRQLRALDIPCLSPHTSIRNEISTLYFILEPSLIRHSLACLELPGVAHHHHPITLTAPERERYAQLRTTMDGHRYQTHPMTYYMRCFNGLRDICLFGTHGPRPTENDVADRTPDHTLVAPDDDVCAICMNLFEKPALTPCDHWFCSECIAMALARAEKCPMCRGVTIPRMLRYGVASNHETAVAVEELFDDPAAEVSSKITAVVARISEILQASSTDKIVLCAHSMSALRRLREAIQTAASTPTKIKMIHGGVPAPHRTAAIHAFQHDANTRIMLVTYRSAAAGITLTAANHVCIVSPNCSNDMETQLVGRAHRFGQTKTVHVHTFFAKDTIEESLLTDKKTLFQLFS